MMRVVALTGLSGVGKTTLLHRMRAHIQFQHLPAGNLIRTARVALREGALSLDELRDVDVDENQKLLIQAFRRELNTTGVCAILDGHTLIERNDGVALIPANVFGSLGIQAMFFLADSPSAIAARRARDTTRTRPAVSVAELHQRQETSRCHADSIAEALEDSVLAFVAVRRS